MEILHDTYTWITLSFVLFVGILWKFGIPALLSRLDAKILTIKSEVEKAAMLRAEAEALLLEFEQRQKYIHQEADSLISEARDRAESLRFREEERLAELMQNKEQQLNERLDLLREQTIAELRQVAATLAYEATQKMVVGQLDPETKKRLVDRALEQVAQRLN